MAKDSQPDNKYSRVFKSKGHTTITEEGKNHNPNTKKQSVKRGDV